MPLTFTGLANRGASPKSGFSPFYLTIPLLADLYSTYDIKAGDKVDMIGELIEVNPLETQNEMNALATIKNRQMKFCYVTSYLIDSLYFSDDAWRAVIQAGFVELKRYQFTIKLTEMTLNNNKIPIIPLRDVRY